MSSVAVSFSLEFPARRQLQSGNAGTAADPSSVAFQTSLRASIAASLGSGLTAEQILIAPVPGNPRKLTVTVTGFDVLDVTPSAVVATVSSPTFVSNVGSSLGVTVAVAEPPAIAMRTTSVPSPPPPSPPGAPPPPPSPSPVSPLTVATDGLSHANSLSDQTGASGLSQEMMWVIIIAVIAVFIVLGCGMAYCLGKRSGKTSTVQIGRPALRRQVSPSEAEAAANAAAVAAGSPSGAGPSSAEAGARPFQDVRLIELGMAMQRSMELTRQPSSGDPGPSSAGALTEEDIALKLVGLQAAIDDVRESLSGGGSPQHRSPRGAGVTPPRGSGITIPLQMQPIETRIRPTSSAEDLQDLHI